MTSDLENEVRDFFLVPSNLQQLSDLHPSHRKISVRLMDFYYEKYCQANHPEIYKSWELHFKKYKKANFDFYARGDNKIVLSCHSIRQNDIVTTVSQLNFFRWMIQSGWLFPSDPAEVRRIVIAQRLLVKYQRYHKKKKWTLKTKNHKDREKNSLNNQNSPDLNILNKKRIIRKSKKNVAKQQKTEFYAEMCTDMLEKLNEHEIVMYMLE